jgi:hypothetical protein
VSEVETIIDAVLLRDRSRVRSVAQIRTRLLADVEEAGWSLVPTEELERLRRSDQSYNEALHTPRDRGGLSNT